MGPPLTDSRGAARPETASAGDETAGRGLDIAYQGGNIVNTSSPDHLTTNMTHVGDAARQVSGNVLVFERPEGLSDEAWASIRASGAAFFAWRVASIQAVR